MRIYSALLLFLIFLGNAQNQRFFYEYKFISDSTDIQDVKTEMMNLDITGTGSRFYSYTVYHSDSLMKVDLEKQLQATGSINIKTDMRKGNIRYYISKTYPDYKVYFHNKILMDGYKVEENRKIKWNILPEKTKIGVWNVQKAETDFGGRHWTAWFCSELPIQDGPYKFHGLPGIIVKIEDKTHSHIFELKGISKIGESVADNDVFKLSEISVNPKQYEKAVKDYENDPTKGMKELSVGGASIIMTGKSADNEKFMREREKEVKERIKKNNNKIELTSN